MDEETSVRKFIESSGFPLEFTSANKLNAAGFVPRHGRTYESPTPGGDTVPREIDVVADLADQRLSVPIQVVVECKHATAPWVVIAGDPEAAPPVLPIAANLPKGARADLPRGVRNAMAIEPPHSFAVHQVRSGLMKPNQVDPAFDAVRQAVSAAVGSLASAGRSPIVTYPVVVLEGSLWRYRYGQEAERILWARLLWWGTIDGHATPVDLVTREAFDAPYLLELREQLVSLSQAAGIISVHAQPETAGF